MSTITVYVSIGNSDDKLTQQRWHEFVDDVRDALDNLALHRHGVWFSASASPWQNACFCVEVRGVMRQTLMKRLSTITARYGQDSIAWAEAQTTFIVPPPSFYGTVTTGEVDSGESR